MGYADRLGYARSPDVPGRPDGARAAHDGAVRKRRRELRRATGSRGGRRHKRPATTPVEAPPPLRKDADVTAGAGSRVRIETSPGLAHRYSECASIWNPIHTERAAARAIGLPGIVLHGTCTWALAGQALIRAAADGDPRRLRRLAGRFKGVVFPGDTLELEYGREDKSTLQFAVRTPRGGLAITHGVAEIDP